MSERGMKKWAPYKSLVEQTDALNMLQSRKERVSRPTLSSDEEELINDILVNYHNQCLEIKYFRNGYIYTIESIIKKIDIQNQRLLLEDKKSIYLNELVGLKEI